PPGAAAACAPTAAGSGRGHSARLLFIHRRTPSANAPSPTRPSSGYEPFSGSCISTTKPDEAPGSNAWPQRQVATFAGTRRAHEGHTIIGIQQALGQARRSPSIYRWSVPRNAVAVLTAARECAGRSRGAAPSTDGAFRRTQADCGGTP